MKFNRKPIFDALEAAREVRLKWDALEAEKAALSAPDVYLDGARAVDEYKAKLAELDAAKQAASAEAVARVQAARATWETEVTEAFSPHGADTVDPDFRLLELALVSTPDELARVLSRHPDSVVFRRMGEKYAAARQWEGFTEPADDAAVEAFAAEAFRQMEIAAQAPDGYFSMCTAEPYYLDGLAAASGCAADWQAAD